MASLRLSQSSLGAPEPDWINAACKNYFGYASLKPFQLAAVRVRACALCSNLFWGPVSLVHSLKEQFFSCRIVPSKTKNALAGRNTFVLMATGSGKSICYQLPSLVSGVKPQSVLILLLFRTGF
jgi:hypothetical protein